MVTVLEVLFSLDVSFGFLSCREILSGYQIFFGGTSLVVQICRQIQ